MFLTKENLKHVSTVTHENKVIVFAIDGEGKVFYTVKQDGFEDSYLSTPEDQRNGWERWQTLEFPNEADDPSVIEKEKAELTYQQNPSQYLLKSLYKTQNEGGVAPVQAISALDHVYIFRQSKSNTLLVDRFVLDGMTNKLNRKLEVRYKRSRQKYTPTKNMQKGAAGLIDIDTLDFRDANGAFFYEPTTELCLVNNLNKGWFSVVLVPTIENDIHRWHIFAYNSQTSEVELTTIRASESGLFDVHDYTILQEAGGSMVPQRIPGVIRRSLGIKGVSITNGLSATKYDLQQAQQTQSGEEQLLRTASRVMLAIPTDKAAAAFSFAIAGDGTLGDINEASDRRVVRSRKKEILLPLNTLDEVKSFGDRILPPQGMVTGFSSGTKEENIEDLVKVTTNGMASWLANADLVRISGTRDYQGLHKILKIDEKTFDIEIPGDSAFGYWEKEEQASRGLIFDGMITGYRKTIDGKIRVTCSNHGLVNGDEVQIIGTGDYNDVFPVQKIDDTNFAIERKWSAGEAVNVKLVSRKRRGTIFNGVVDSVEIPYSQSLNSNPFTFSVWVKVTGGQGSYRSPLASRDTDSFAGFCLYASESNKWEAWIGSSEKRWVQIIGPNVVVDAWTHIAVSYDGSTLNLYVDGVLCGTIASTYNPNRAQPLRIGSGSVNQSGGKSKASNFFPGNVSDVCIWSLAHNAKTIKDNMYLQLTGKEVGLTGYWRLGGISEGKILDFSVSNHDSIIYGEPFVSAATLNRKLAGGALAVKYSNPELFSVSERATYEESFEFKVNADRPVDIVYLDNPDGMRFGAKIFTFSYWGKNSRSAEEIKTFDGVQNRFEDLGKGWYRASCNVTIPDKVSLLRAFEISNIRGSWQSIEIRKHRIRLLSDSISEARYTDVVALSTLADFYAGIPAKLKEMQTKEKEEVILLKEKQSLEAKIAAYDNQSGTRAEIENLSAQIQRLNAEERVLSDEYIKQKNNPFNYVCRMVNRFTAPWNESLKQLAACGAYDDNRNFYYDARIKACDDQPQYQDWKFVSLGGDKYHIINTAYPNHRLASCGMLINGHSVNNAILRPAENEPVYHQWKIVSEGDEGYYIINTAYPDVNLTSKRLGSLSDPYLDACLTDTANTVNCFRWRIVPTKEHSNNLIVSALLAWQEVVDKIPLLNTKLESLKAALVARAETRAGWVTRLNQVISLLTKIQTEINTLNTDILNAGKSIQAKPQVMPQLAKDSKGMATQGALLGFVQPATRLNAIETCEGNVQLSYFDNEGRMRQTIYDATADGNNGAFEQWIPDAQRVCLSLAYGRSIVRPNQALSLPDDWTLEAWFSYPLPAVAENTLTFGPYNGKITVKNGKDLGVLMYRNDAIGQGFYSSGFNLEQLSEGWHHLAVVAKDDTTLLYIDGRLVGDVKRKLLSDAEASLRSRPNDGELKRKLELIKKEKIKIVGSIEGIGGNQVVENQQFGKLAEVRIWSLALNENEIIINGNTSLSGNEPGLLAYYPMNEATGDQIRDHSANGNHATASLGIWWACTAPIGKIDNFANTEVRELNASTLPKGSDALVCAEYSTVTFNTATKAKLAMMRRFFAYPASNGITLLPDKRVEALELKWIGSGQFAPTLLGYIEGAPPVPSENLTLSDDYNGATSVELTMSEDVQFSWNRSQESGLGATADIFAGVETEAEAGFILSSRIAAMRVGFKGNIDFNYQFLNQSNIASGSALSLTDKLELRGSPEQTAHFPHLGNRFIPKNVGYALVVSAISDVFVTRLSRSGKMVGYKVLPVEGLPPDVNTITFLMNPAYTMNGSLDGMTGSYPTSDRFFRHVPEMRAQYGSLYPASYYRLKEAYDLKEQIEAEDKRRESYFSNFDVRAVDETSLDRNIDSGNAPTSIGVHRQEDKPAAQMTEEDKKAAEAAKLQSLQADANAKVDQQSLATKAKQEEIQSKITDQEKRVQATESFAGWQKRMEALQIRSAKRNIVNTYVWDADGGLRAEQQSFANTVEHTIGGSFSLNAALGVEAKFGAIATAELTAQATINLTQTMAKTESRSKGFQLNVDLSGLEYRGITNYNDSPILPGEKVDRYRFMSFYLEGSTTNFQDFFRYVVDPEWLRSNDEEAIALRQAQFGKPNKAWRVLHRVTYVERPSLMGIGKDVRKIRPTAAASEYQNLLDKITRIEQDNSQLRAQLGTIISLLKK